MSDHEDVDIDLAGLSDDDLASQMHDDLYDGLGDEIVEGTNILLERGWSADRVLQEALVEGMRIVGIDFLDPPARIGNHLGYSNPECSAHRSPHSPGCSQIRRTGSRAVGEFLPTGQSSNTSFTAASITNSPRH